MSLNNLSYGVVNSGNSSSNLPDAMPMPLRLGRQGEQIMQQLHGKLYENAVRGKLFFGGNGATPATTTVALATTYTGLALINPVNSGKNLIIEKVGYSFLVAFAAASSIGLLVGSSATGIVTSSAAAMPGASCLIGGSATPAGRCALSATLVGTPALAMIFGAGVTGAITTVPEKAPTLVDVDGAIILAPGAYAAIYTSTASGASALAGSFLWSEEPAA